MQRLPTLTVCTLCWHHVPDFGSGPGKSGIRPFLEIRPNPALARILTGFGAAVPYGNIFQQQLIVLERTQIFDKLKHLASPLSSATQKCRDIDLLEVQSLHLLDV